MLQQRGTGVFLVSGGFRAIIDPIADMLRIPQDHVYANTILFKVCGPYSLFPCIRSMHGSAITCT
jgi:phosphoserine phosphatase